ncbi:MAG: EAL domain-containing protein [Maricaulis sp.]|nr:EAL domain-containing protein [Maricaulis sp.]
MPRLMDIYVVMLYASIALVAAAAFDYFNLMSTTYAWLMGAMVFLVAGQVYSSVLRSQERAETRDEIHKLKASNRELADEFAAAQQRLDAITDDIRTEAVERDNALVHEVKVLEDLVRRVGDGPSDQGALGSQTSTTKVNIATVREALADNRVDLYLQPIVSLPQRRTYFYESFTRLRDATGRILPPGAFLEAAEQAGLMTEVDNVLLFRCVQIVRRLTQQDRRVAIFCNISMNSLADEEFFPSFLDFIRQNSDLAGSLIFELPQRAFDERNAIAARNMARMVDFGFRFSIDQVNDVNMDLNALQRAGVRFVKIVGEQLIGAITEYKPIGGLEGGALTAEDVAGHFARYGVDLIAEKVESESTIVEILELDIAYGQGHLFGEPRPVRGEMIEAADEQPRKSA